MCVTAFLSMWINNSAATSIMMPAAIAIVDELENYGKKTFLNRQQSHEILPIDTESKRICFCWILKDKKNLAVFDVKTIVEEENDNKATNINDE